MDACEFLASRVGLYTEPSSGTSIAVLRKFLASGAANKSDKIAVMVCGSGFRETVTFSEKRPFTPNAINLDAMLENITL